MDRSRAFFLSPGFIVFTVKTGKIISYSVIIPEFIYGDLDNGRVIVGGFYEHWLFMRDTCRRNVNNKRRQDSVAARRRTTLKIE